MTVIWLSPALPVDRAHVAALLSDQHTIAAPTDLPPRDSLAVATSDERQLLAALAARPADISVLLVAPAGQEVPREVAEQVRAETVGTVTGDQDAAELIAAAAGRRRAATAWPDYRGGAALAPAGALGTAAGRAGPGRGRGQLLASALVAVAILVAAVLVVTNHTSSSAAATGGAGTAGAGAGAPGGTTGEGGGTTAGGGTAGGGNGAAGGGSALTTAQITKLVACLKEKGVSVPSGTTTTLPRLDLSNTTTRAAMQSCGTALGLGAGPAGAGSAAGGTGTGGTGTGGTGAGGTGTAPSGRPSAPAGA